MIIEVTDTGVWTTEPTLKDAIRKFVQGYDPSSESHRETRTKLMEVLQRELYRREREYPEFVDLGGEG